MNEEEFLREDFSLNEYLSKILADSTGECSRLKDKHIRILSKNSAALSKEMLHKKDKIKDGLVTLSLLIEEAKRISKELPDLFLPTANTAENTAGNSEKHEELESELGKISGDTSVLSRGRTLKHKESVKLRIDGEVYTGIVILSEDIVIFGIDEKNGRELYNALLIKEVTCTMENDVLVVSLPPVRIEIVEAESAFSSLQQILVGRGSEGRPSKERNKPQHAQSTSRKIDDLEYKDYLVRIGRVETIDTPEADDVSSEIRSVYRMCGWKGCTALLNLLKKVNLMRAVELYCEIEGSKIEKTVHGVIHAKGPSGTIIDKLHVLLGHYIKGLEEVFPETDASGYLSLHLDSIHRKTAESFYRLFYLTNSVNDMGGVDAKLTEKLKNAFVYEGYSFSYTVKIGDEIKKSILKDRYTFNKNVMSNVFKKVSKVNSKSEVNASKNKNRRPV